MKTLFLASACCLTFFIVSEDTARADAARVACQSTIGGQVTIRMGQCYTYEVLVGVGAAQPRGTGYGSGTARIACQSTIGGQVTIRMGQCYTYEVLVGVIGD